MIAPHPTRPSSTHDYLIALVATFLWATMTIFQLPDDTTPHTAAGADFVAAA
ncbi:MAG TPA: hypothetical protein G4N99_10850 [Thermoflexia bacterium]|nr:hypothetical protein [Thermoflexia bacterium]